MELNIKKYIQLAVMLAVTLIIANMKPFGQITPFGMKVLGVFIGVLVGWIIFDLFWSSIYGFFAIALFNLQGITAAMSTGLGNQQLITTMLAMAFAIAIDMAGLTDMIANWMLSRKIVQKSPWSLVIGILITGYVLGFFGLGMAAIFLLWSLVYKIAEYCGLKKGDTIVSLLIAFIPFLCMTAAMILPFHAGVLVFMTYFTQTLQTSFVASQYITFAMIVFTLIFIATFVLTALLLRVKVSNFSLPPQVLEEIKQTKVTQKQKISFCVLIAFVAILLYGSIFTKAPGAAFINRLGVAGMSVLGILVLAVLSDKGQGYVKLKAIFSNVDWGLMMLVAVTYPLADLMRSADAGIMPTIMAFVMPKIAGMSVSTFMIVCMVILGLVTQITHNIVLAAMFMPFLLPICVNMGGNPYTLWFVLFLALNSAYATPAGCMQSAMVFGNEWMTGKHGYVFGLTLMVVTWVILAVIGIPLGNMIFVG